MDEIIQKSLELDYEILTKKQSNKRMATFFSTVYKLNSKDILKEFDSYAAQAKELFTSLDELFVKADEERKVSGLTQCFRTLVIQSAKEKLQIERFLKGEDCMFIASRMKIHEELKEKALEFMHRRIEEMGKRIAKLIDRQNNLLDLLRLKKSQESYIAAIHEQKAFLAKGAQADSWAKLAKRSSLPTCESSRIVSKLSLRESSELNRSVESYSKGLAIVGKTKGRNSCLNSRRTSLAKQGDTSKNSSTGTCIPILTELHKNSTEAKQNGKKALPKRGLNQTNHMPMKKPENFKSLLLKESSKKTMRNKKGLLSSSISHKPKNI